MAEADNQGNISRQIEEILNKAEITGKTLFNQENSNKYIAIRMVHSDDQTRFAQTLIGISDSAEEIYQLILNEGKERGGEYYIFFPKCDNSPGRHGRLIRLASGEFTSWRPGDSEDPFLI